MSALTQLLTLCWAAALFTLVLWVPGWWVGRCAGVRGWPALAVAPGVSTLMVAVSATALGALGWRWDVAGPPAVAVLSLLTGAAMSLATRLLGGRGGARGARGLLTRAGASSLLEGLRARCGRGGAAAAWRCSWRQQAPVVGAVLVCAATSVVAYAWGAVDPGWPAQAFDAVFHLNAVAVIREEGNASLYGGLAVLYQGRSVYYPSLWHALVALLPGEVSLATNAALTATGALLWPCALAGMLVGVRDLLPGSRQVRQWAVGLTVLLGGSAVAFAVLLTSLTAWPYALSVLALPGVLLLAHDLARGAGPAGSSTGRGHAAVTACLLALCAAGAAAAHGTGAFNVLLLLVAWLPALAGVLTARLPSSRVRRLVVAAALVAVVGGLWVMRRPLAGVLGYPRASGGWGGLVGTLGQALVDLPTYGGVSSWTALLGGVTGVLTLAGVRAAWRTPAGRRWVGAWAAALVLTVVVGGPSWWGRQIGSLWYLQKARLIPLVLLPALVLVSVAWSRLLTRVLSRWGGGARSAGSASRPPVPRPVVLAIVIGLVVVLGAGRLPLHRDLVASVHDPARIQYGTLVSRREIAFMRQASSLLPPGAVVIGAPSRGASLLWALGDVHVVYPTRSWAQRGSTARELVKTWPGLLEGEEGRQQGADQDSDREADREAVVQKVCGLLDEIGAFYVYTDSSSDAEGTQPPLRWDAPLAQVPPDLVDLVASDGDYALWRFSACERRSG